MSCSLYKLLKKEHDAMANKNLSDVIVDCPVIGKQICLWCCLHISDAATPLTREHTLNMYPGIAKVQEISGRDFDSINETCARCRVRY